MTGIINLFFLVFLSEYAEGNEFKLTSSSKKMAVLELYTSEGCSSCPPADKWINSLEKKSGLWTEFIPVVFHVDYWNSLGWVDPLSSGRYAERQRLYAKSWGEKSVYTPGVVKNGKEWKGWRNSNKIASSNSNLVGVLKVEGKDDSFSLTFHTDKSDKYRNLEFHAGVMLMGFKSKVTNGENAGETLEHSFSICSFNSAPATKDAENFAGKLTLESCSKYGNTRKAVVFWVSEKNAPEPIQAVAGAWN